MGKKTNYHGTFKRATTTGKSPWNTIQKISQQNNCTPTQVCNSLCQDHTCFTKPFNGHKFCFPCNYKKTTRKNSKETEYYFWQYAVEFAIQQGWVTPEQVYSWTNEQLFWYVCNQFNKFYSKPKNFNPNKKVSGFPTTWFNTPTKKNVKSKTTGRKRKTTGKSKTRKTVGRTTTTTGSKTRKPKRTTRPTSRRRTQNPRLRLVGGNRTTTRRRAA